MAVVVAAAAASHAPGLTGWFDAAPEGDRGVVVEAFRSIRQRFEAAGVEVVVLIGNDHVNNDRLENLPDFMVGAAAVHCGPHEWFKPWLKVPPYELPGRPDLAEYVTDNVRVPNVTVRMTRENLRFDDNLSVPAHLLGMPEWGVQVVPILQNCTVPPMADQQACYAWGQQLRAAIESFPAETRVGLFGSGGMSHEPGGPRYFEIDEKFDRWFLGLLEQNERDEVLKEVSIDRMEDAGSGGTAELLSWITVLGAVDPDAQCHVLGYSAVNEWRSGIGAVAWDL